MERLRSRNVLRTSALAVSMLFGAAACANYSGNGNEFVVRGEITEVGEQSLAADIYEIEETHGEADGWFEDGTSHRIHDNCDCHGAWSGRKTYGVVLDNAGEEIDISELQEGQCVEFTGKIRSNKEGKSHSDRPVFDTAQIVPCG